jgi:hypothetical protein
MGFLRRAILIVTVLAQLLTCGWVMLVIGSSGILGDVALISAANAMVAFVLAAVTAVLTLIEVLLLWRSGRTRRRLARELASRPAVGYAPVIGPSGPATYQ